MAVPANEMSFLAEFDEDILVKRLLFALVSCFPGADDFFLALKEVEKQVLLQFIMLNFHDRAADEMPNPVAGIESSL